MIDHILIEMILIEMAMVVINKCDCQFNHSHASEGIWSTTKWWSVNVVNFNFWVNYCFKSREEKDMKKIKKSGRLLKGEKENNLWKWVLEGKGEMKWQIRADLLQMGRGREDGEVNGRSQKDLTPTVKLAIWEPSGPNLHAFTFYC